MNEAGVAPPGTMPIMQPTAELRRDVFQYFGSSFQVSITTRMLSLACAPLNSSPSSMVSRISPMPNRPITAIRKSNPFSRSVKPNVMRSAPVTVSVPTAASAKPSIIEAMVLKGEPLLMPTKAQNVSRYTEKNSGGPKRSANLATIGDRNVMSSTATSAPTNDDGNAAVSGAPARPFWPRGYPSNVVATDHGSPGMLKRIDVMAPPKSAPP